MWYRPGFASFAMTPSILLNFIKTANAPAAENHAVKHPFQCNLQHLFSADLDSVDIDYRQLFCNLLMLAWVDQFELDFIILEKNTYVMAFSRIFIEKICMYDHFCIIFDARVACFNPLVFVKRIVNSAFKGPKVWANVALKNLPKDARVFQVLASLKVSYVAPAHLYFFI